MSERTDKSDNLFNAITLTIEQHSKGMTTYQIIGTLMSVILWFWELHARQEQA